MQIAVVIFNLGGPDSLDSVKPFLFNLFNDPHIISLPQPFRYILAKFISHFRQNKSKSIYSKMGGKSTILEETEKQAKALSDLLNKNFSLNDKISYEVITMMRYWEPNSDSVIKKIHDKKYDEIILLPLYPQFSTTTTLSSLRDWFKKASDLPNNLVCCYYNHPTFIEAHLNLIKEALKNFKTNKSIRLLFSAHSIPQHISDRGDPYKEQIEETIRLIMESLPNFSHSLCYQSKVGRLKWLGPSLEEELLATGDRREAALVIPITFTSEHSETLVELDLDYKNLAEEKGIDFYRVPTLSSHSSFIKTLADLVVQKLSKNFPDLYESSNLDLAQASLPFPCRASLCCQKINLLK
jgi:ferrochelatase